MPTIIRTTAFLTVIVAAALLAPEPARAQGTAQYTILIWETPAQLALRTDASKGPAYWSAYADFGNQLQQAGVLRGGTALRTGDAVRVVTIRSGATTVTPEGQRSVANELGGYFIIEVGTLDEAVRWAARAPAAPTGRVEVWPAYPSPAMMKRE